MIAIDTNVLLRYLLQDEPSQSNKAMTIINGKIKILITDVALIETVCVLMRTRYNLSKEKITDVIYALFAEPNIVFEDGQAVWFALRDYVNAGPIRVKGKTKQAGSFRCVDSQ